MKHSRDLTHELFVQGIRAEVIRVAYERGRINADEAAKLKATKLVYGAGQSGVRGVCYFGTWKTAAGQVDLVEIGAMAQENWVQLMGTTMHELGHVLAGLGEGHSKTWKETCERLGFRVQPEAAGQKYRLAMFIPVLREFGADLAVKVADGSPAFKGTVGATWLSTMVSMMARPCGAGHGTRGGKSRSGRRALWQCACERPVKVYTTATLNAVCNECETAFTKA